MATRYLEVTYRKGKPLAAYFYLPRKQGDTVARSEPAPGDLVIDFAPDGRPLGIEILAPATLTTATLDAALASCNLPGSTSAELQPLAAA